MSFYIDYNELRNYKYNIVSQMSAISLNLEEIDMALANMIIEPAMTGQGAEQIYSYLYDMISNTIPIIYTIIIDYTSKLSLLEAGIYEYEPEIYGVLPEEEINSVVDAYKTAYGDAYQLSEEVKGVINSVSGICDFENPSVSKYAEHMGAVITKGTNLVKGIQNFDEAHYNCELAQLEQLLDSAIELIDTLNSQSWDITQYEMGTFASLPEYESVMKEMTDTLRYHEYNQEELENANTLCEIRLRGVLSDERLKEGLCELLMGADATGTGIAALKLGSMATVPFPIKIGAALLIYLGLYEVEDGIKDLEYGTHGDPYTNTDNYLKRLLGEDAYYAILQGGTLALGGYTSIRSVYELARLKFTGSNLDIKPSVVDDMIPDETIDNLVAGVTNNSDTASALDNMLSPGNVDNLATAGKPDYSDFLNPSAADNVVEGGIKPGTLSNVEARKWYLEQEAKIPDLIDDSLPLEQQARQAFDLRNQYRTQTRELMSDRKLAESLYATDPNLTWEQVIQKQVDKGLSGDDIYKAIIESSQRSRTSVNQSLGLE